LALLESSLGSDDWAEPYQSAQTLASFGTAAGDALPELFAVLINKNDLSTEAKDSLFQAIYAIQPDSLAISVSGNLPEFEAVVACGIFSGYEPFMSDAEANMPIIIEALKDKKRRSGLCRPSSLANGLRVIAIR
jgi:hypothetical protein